MHLCVPGQVAATRADGWTSGMEGGSKLRPKASQGGGGSTVQNHRAGRTSLPVLVWLRAPFLQTRITRPNRKANGREQINSEHIKGEKGGGGEEEKVV